MSINIGNSIKFFDAIVTVVSCPLSVAASDLKSDNLQYNMMRQWDDSMNAPTESATHWTIYSATTFLEKCRKVVLEKWFCKLGFFFLVNHFS